MTTSSRTNLTINNFMDPVSYTSGKGTASIEKQLVNFYDSKLSFLNGGYNCTIYTLTRPNFLPNISYKFYGTTSLWWVIARFNGIIFPLKEIKVGVTLNIPELTDISKALNKAQTKTSSSSSQRVIL